MKKGQKLPKIANYGQNLLDLQHGCTALPELTAFEHLAGFFAMTLSSRYLEILVHPTKARTNQIILILALVQNSRKKNTSSRVYIAYKYVSDPRNSKIHFIC
jgi:hypothetical protein